MTLAAPPQNAQVTHRGADSLRRRRRRRPFDGSSGDVEGGGWGAKCGEGVGIRFGIVARSIAGTDRRGNDGRAGGIRLGVPLMGGWHPAAEPEEDSEEDTHYDSWRKMRVEEIIKDPFLTPGR